MSKRIILSGPSGCGKTTLATEISRQLGIPFISNSAGDILSEEDKVELHRDFGWKAQGHREVIRLSSINPDFGYQFQYRVLMARKKLYLLNDEAIFDRSFIDNAVYFTLQVAPYIDYDKCLAFYNECKELQETLVDKTIIISYERQLEVEENGSRVSNLIYQQAVDDVFKGLLRRVFFKNTKVTLLTRDFTQRVSAVMPYLSK